jgi:hypothetical protein
MARKLRGFEHPKRSVMTYNKAFYKRVQFEMVHTQLHPFDSKLSASSYPYIDTIKNYSPFELPA